MTERFNKIILLSHGSPTYDGDVEGCIKFFDDCGYSLPKNTNPTDFFLDTISYDTRTVKSTKHTADVINGLRKEWESIGEKKESKINEILDIDISTNHSVNISSLIARNISNMRRDINFQKSRLFQKIALVTLFGFTYLQLGNKSDVDVFSYRGLITFLIINSLFGICGPIFNLFGDEKKIIKRERMSGLYSGYEAYISEFVSQGMFSILYEAPSLLIIYYLVGLRSNFGICVIFILILMVSTLFSVSFALTISTIAPTTMAAQVFGITSCIFFILYSGAFSNPETLPSVLKWVIWISPTQYAFRAALQNQLNGNTLNGQSGEKILKSFGLTGYGITASVFTLIGFMVLFQVIGSVVLHMQTKNNLKMEVQETPE